MDPVATQWLNFFDSGQRYDIFYNPLAADQAELDKGMAEGIGFPGGGLLTGLYLGQMTQNARYKFIHFFGDNPRPSIGISNAGLHFPEIPLIRWEDIAGAGFGELRGLRNRAANGGMIPEPNTGGAHSKENSTMTIFVRNASLILGTMNPKYHDLFELHTAASGQPMATLWLPLDPGLGAEQVVEFVYLFNLMAYRRGIVPFYTAGMRGAFEDMNIGKAIFAAN